MDRLITLLFAGAAMVTNTFARTPASIAVSSPNDKIVVTISIKEKLEPYPEGQRLYYNVQYNDRELLLDSPFGLDFKHQPPLAKNLQITSQHQQTINETWQRVWGRNKNVVNHCNELHMKLEESQSPFRHLDLIFRVYDDGVAFRYHLPDQTALSEFRLSSERAVFCFANNHQVWAANYGSFISHQESEFNQITLNDISANDIIGCPLLVKVSDSAWVAVTEANLTD